MEQPASSQYEVCVEMRTCKQLVHIAAVAAHFLGKPCHAVALIAQFAENHIAEMDVAHSQAVRLSLCGRLPDAVVLLLCFVGT